MSVVPIAFKMVFMTLMLALMKVRTTLYETPFICGIFFFFLSQFALDNFFFLKSVLRKNREIIISLIMICQSTFVFQAND